jgi:hypothetical protein
MSSYVDMRTKSESYCTRIKSEVVRPMFGVSSVASHLTYVDAGRGGTRK